MDAREYQNLAMRTCAIPYDRDPLTELIPDNRKRGMLIHGVTLTSSEVGEVAGLVQKVYQGHEFDLEHMKKELGDVLWGVAEICTALDIDMGDAMETNIAKLKARYPEGFDVEHSLHRKEGDV